jgi:hypothetical protein
MVEDSAPVRRRRLGAHGIMFRRRRIFAQLREGFTYDEIAAEEGVSPSRIDRSSRGSCSTARSIAGQSMRSCSWTVLLPRFNSRPSHGRSDISAITLYLKALDRLDRYQTFATANQVYDDDEARNKLMDKINRMAANFGIDENFAAEVEEHLKTIGAIPDDEPVEGGGEGARPAGSPEFTGEAGAPEATHCRGCCEVRIFLLETAVTH